MAQLDPIQRFVELQNKLLASYGVNATSRFVHLNKPPMRAHVLEAGVGEPVMLFHGGDGEGVNWAPIMGLLQSSFRLYAIDRPGFGLSDAFDYRGVNLRENAVDFVASLLDALDLKSVSLIGSSMGGFFVLAAALAQPDRVSKLILVGYPVGAIRSLPLPFRIICGIPGLSRRFMKSRPTMEAQRKQYRDMFHVDLDKIPTLYFETRIAGIQLPSEQNTWAELLPRVADLRGIRREVYLGDELSRIKVPVLMIMGDHDMAPPEAGRAVIAKIPDGRFEHLPGVAHFPYLEAPERTAELIADFLSAGSR
jgi:pimeloyl-ACP methyl ester carboxylesterase